MFCVVHCKRAGFTLIEIMIVIAIIAILAAVVVPNFVQARFEAQVTACHENCRIGLEAVQMARIRHTWDEVLSMCDNAYRYGDASYGWNTGNIGSKFVEAGYLGKALKCTVMGNEYTLMRDWASPPRVDGMLWKDWQYTQELYDGCNSCGVCCWSGHMPLPGVPVYATLGVCPFYEESYGACFFW